MFRFLHFLINLDINRAIIMALYIPRQAASNNTTWRGITKRTEQMRALQSRLFGKQFHHQRRAVLQAIEEGFVFVGDAEAAAEIELSSRGSDSRKVSSSA